MTQRRPHRQSRNARRYRRAYREGYRIGRQHTWFVGCGCGIVFTLLTVTWTLWLSNSRTDQASVTIIAPLVEPTFRSDAEGASSPLEAPLKQLVADGWL